MPEDKHARAPAWYVISLRPQGEHGPLRSAVGRFGGRVVGVAPWRLEMLGGDGVRDVLRRALAAPRVLFTSPAAVRAAAALLPLRAAAGQHWLAVGSGTAAALRKAGVVDVASPRRMDSEGLLDLPALQQLVGLTVGLVTAPGGRGMLAPALGQRGATVIRADVYRREPVPVPARTLAKLRTLDAPAVLAVSSGEALQRLLAAVPADIAERLQRLHVVAASERLGELAHASGFPKATIAHSARPADLARAAARILGAAAGDRGIR